MALALAIFILIGLSAASKAFATTGNNGGRAISDPELPVAVVLGTTYSSALDASDYDNSLGALPNSVSLSEYAVTGPATVSISLSDLYYVGDYYTIYSDTDPGFSSPAPTVVGTTPQVQTGPSLVAPSYNPNWDGAGSTYSGGTFTVAVGAGTTYFVVVDDLFSAMGSLLDTPCGVTTDVLLSAGCTVTGTPGITVFAAFNPAGYEITFNAAAPIGAPEFGTSTLAVAAVILPLLIILRARRFGRPTG